MLCIYTDNEPKFFSLSLSLSLSTQCNVPTCDRLALDTKILDISITNRDNDLIAVDRVTGGDGDNGKGILIDIPRTNASGEGLQVRTLMC